MQILKIIFDFDDIMTSQTLTTFPGMVINRAKIYVLTSSSFGGVKAHTQNCAFYIDFFLANWKLMQGKHSFLGKNASLHCSCCLVEILQTKLKSHNHVLTITKKREVATIDGKAFMTRQNVRR